MDKLRLWYLKLSRKFWPRSERLRIPQFTAAQRRDLIASLAQHPGWIYLIAELEDRKAIHESLRDGLLADLTAATPDAVFKAELLRLNEAIFWLGWIQDKVHRANAFPDLAPYARVPDADAERVTVQ